MADAAELDRAYGYLTHAVAPTASECAVYVAAVGAGAAVAASAGYIANAWVNLRGGHRFRPEDVSLGASPGQHTCVNRLIDSRSDTLR